MTILGSLVIHSTNPVPELPLAELRDLTKREGRHVSGKYNGTYREYFDMPSLEVMLPHRYKRLSILASPGYGQDLAEILATLDTQKEDAPQRDKLALLMEQMTGEFSASVNVMNTGADGQASSGAFYVLNSGCPMYTALVFDSNGGSVQLVWATFDFKASLRRVGALNYAFYTMPDRGFLFVPSHSICSKWWRNARAFDGQAYNQVKAANAIEMLLFKPLTNHGLR
jgi:hypothetical protein